MGCLFMLIVMICCGLLMLLLDILYVQGAKISLEGILVCNEYAKCTLNIYINS